MTPAAALAMHRNDPLGRWLTSPAAEDAWRVGRERLVEALRQLGEELSPDDPLTPEDLLGLVEVLEQFDGAVTLGLSLDPEVAVGGSDLSQIGFILRVSPRAGDDLDELGDLIDRALATGRRNAPGELSEETAQVGGIDVTIFSDPDLEPARYLEFTAPFRVGESVCVAIGGDVRSLLNEALTGAPESDELAADLKKSSLLVRVDLGGLYPFVDALADVVAAQGAPVDAETMRTVIDELGIDTLETISYRFTSEAGHHLADLSVGWSETPSGLLGAFIPDPGTTSSLQRYIPYQLHTSFL